VSGEEEEKSRAVRRVFIDILRCAYHEPWTREGTREDGTWKWLPYHPMGQESVHGTEPWKRKALMIQNRRKRMSFHITLIYLFGAYQVKKNQCDKLYERTLS